MSFAFTLEHHDGDVGDRATIYSFRKEGEEQNEIEKFWAKPDVQNAPDHDPLRIRLYREVLEEWNFGHRSCYHGDDRWFRDESLGSDHDDLYTEALCARIPAKDRRHLTKPYPALRLYCFRLDRVLIAGNGGVKEDQRIQDDPELEAAWNDVRYVMQRVHERTMQGRLRLIDDGFDLSGELDFAQPNYP